MLLIIKNISLCHSLCHARSPRKNQGVRERRGVGNTKNSVHFPRKVRGVHALRGFDTEATFYHYFLVFDNGFRRGDRNVRQKYLNFLLIWKNK